MNRRSFFKALTTGIIGLAIAPSPIKLFTECVDIGPIGEFEFYIKYTWEMYVLNPRACCIIENIE